MPILTFLRIGTVICSNQPSEPWDVLIEKAKERGGHDNITVVIGKSRN
jgi:serine/threonine protein phosphatase PrpC